MKRKARSVTIYTDGSCYPNPGPGGWAARLLFPVPGREGSYISKDISGNDPETTNNRMEVQAAISALRSLRRGKYLVDLYTDSMYLKEGITKWARGWAKRGWRGSEGQPVKNKDLWMELVAISKCHWVTWHHVKGHSGHTHNEAVDKLAGEARKALPAEDDIPW